MAEFQEVMKQWNRMCNAVPGKAGHINLCSDIISGYVCPLRENGMCNLAIEAQSIEDWKEGEYIIMAWAAEHPEPVYPSWYRWLIMMGAVGSVEDLFSDLQRPIPADIAEKLGLAPKEG